MKFLALVTTWVEVEADTIEEAETKLLDTHSDVFEIFEDK